MHSYSILNSSGNEPASARMTAYTCVDVAGIKILHGSKMAGQYSAALPLSTLAPSKSARTWHRFLGTQQLSTSKPFVLPSATRLAHALACIKGSLERFTRYRVESVVTSKPVGRMAQTTETRNQVILFLPDFYRLMRVPLSAFKPSLINSWCGVAPISLKNSPKKK